MFMAEVLCLSWVIAPSVLGELGVAATGVGG